MLKSKLLPAAVVVACACASCTNEVPEIPSTELYTREWVKAFGAVDSRQDWNNATRGSVRVTTPAAERVRITAKIGKNNYLLADYADVAGTRDLSFDMPRGVDAISVISGTATIDTKPGGTADFSASGRAIWDDKEPTEVVAISRVAYREISDKAVLSFAEYLPEEKDNLGKVTQNFSYISKGPFTVFPVYWNTNAYLTLGVYYLENEGTDDEQMVYVPFYSNKISHRNNDGSGNLEYWKYDARYPGFAGGWYVPKWGDWQRLEISGSRASEIVIGKSSFNDYTDEDWATFEAWVIEQYPLFNSNGSRNDAWRILQTYDNELNGLSDNQRAALKIKAIRHTVADGNAYVEAIELNGVESENIGGKWVYPEGAQCSHPEYDKYKGYYYDGMSYDEIAAKNFLPAKWRSEGVLVDIKPGTKFGMFIRHEYQAPQESTVQTRKVKMVYDEEKGYKIPENDGYRRMYSQAKYNTDVMSDPENPGQTINSVHAATYDYPAPSGITYQVLAFEDWHGTTLYDLNDMVFFIDAGSTFDNPKVTDEDKPEPEPVKWLVACEDLGAKDDFDFNDVVFEVEHVAGQRTARITPLAAGGTLETYLMRDGVEISPEWHSLFGGAWYTQMINTTGFTVRAESFEIEVPEDFTLSSSPDGDYRTNMGGFHLKVVRDDSSEDTITPPGLGDAPQMLLIYQSADGKWQWPRERHNIKLAYREFESWMNSGNYDIDTSEGGSNWFDNAHPDHVVKR